DPGPQKSSENDAFMKTVVMEALSAYEESRKAPSKFNCEVENLFIPSVSKTISTKEEAAGSIITEADNAHLNINGQHKVRKKSLDTEDEFPGQCESQDSRDKDRPRRSKEPEVISQENPLYIKESPESEEKSGQTSSLKSDIECSFNKLASLDITDKCQDTKDISNNYVEVPPVNDSSITKLDKVLESQFSRENEGLSNKECEADKHRKKDKKKMYDSKKTDKEHYRKKRENSDTEEKEKQTRSKPDDPPHKRRRCSRSLETNKQNRHKQVYCHESKYRSSHNERNSPNNGKSSGKYSRYRSRSRERTEQDRNRYYHSKGERTWSRERYYQDEPRRWEKCRYYNDYYSFHGTRDGRERKSSHCDKDSDKSSLAYNRSHKDYHCKNRWPHNTLFREDDIHQFSSHRANIHHCSTPQKQSEKYYRERHAVPPMSAHSNFDVSSRENETLRNVKRKYSHTEESGSEIEKKCRKTDDQRMKKYKKVKKKKKSKEKHREKDY
ncbi:PREDICTED: ubiquitin carboxyl-terminal hydrolase 42-like, partial [Pterocles gutturalis]|uniref:ubiquitin carboxyl-terminal hydrolase 42-like n=1 Tax=Pterocles gutturalis TaxID=240206 RepID=UPI00052930C0